MSSKITVLTIWFTNGVTAQFEHVCDVKVYGGQLSFKYNGRTHKSPKEAAFLMENIAGHSCGEVTQSDLENSHKERAVMGHGTQGQGNTTPDERGTNREKQQKPNNNPNGNGNS